jgi:hypothetical protein
VRALAGGFGATAAADAEGSSPDPLSAPGANGRRHVMRCVRFKRLEDIDLVAIGRLIAGTAVDEFIARYEAGRKKA